MRNEKSFKQFLEKTVNLNETRYTVAKTATGAITDFLNKNELLKKYYILTKTQGSYRQETIIKPVVEDGEFDVDLLFEMEEVEGWEPKDYLENIAKQFKDSDRYKDKVDTRGKSRCVTIDYDNDFHLDIVPAVKHEDCYKIMNKKTNQFEQTDGDGYAEWFEKKSGFVGKKHLVKVVRLIKFIRDYCQSFEVKSILLTTLLGQQVKDSDNVATDYADIPTAFITLFSRLDTYLQANTKMPMIMNPVLPNENFNRHWDQAKYNTFRSEIHKLLILSLDAFNEQEGSKSIEKWQKVFGESFKGDETEVAKSFSLTRDPGEQFLSDQNIHENLRYHLRINAHVKQNGYRKQLLSKMNWLRKSRSLEFFIESCDVPKPFSVKWKVKNKGKEAAAVDLRGKIYDDDGSHSRTESTKYEGEHYVECYIIKDGFCVAKDRIDVPVGKN